MFEKWTFNVLAVVTICFALIIICIMTLLMLMGWEGAIGAPLDMAGRFISLGIMALSLLLLILPLIIVRARVTGYRLSIWATSAVVAFVIAMSGLGLFSLIADPGDFVWSGLPLVIFGVCLGWLLIIQRRVTMHALP